MPQFRKHAALPLRSLLSLETHLQREKRKKALVNFPSQVTSPLKVQRTLAVSSGQFGLAVSTKPKDARRSWARPEPHSPSCFFGANVQSRSPRSSPPSSPGTPGLRGRLRAPAPSRSQTLVPRREQRAPLRRPPDSLQEHRAPASSVCLLVSRDHNPSPSSPRRWGGGVAATGGGAHLLRIGTPRAHRGRGARAGHAVGTRALLLPGTRL